MRGKDGKQKLSDMLLARGIRPTRQRLTLAGILFDGKPKHLTAEEVHKIIHRSRVSISLATVYNNLHAFTKVGLLREISIDSARSYFDTNQMAHHHYFDEATGMLEDIPHKDLRISRLPKPPVGRRIVGLDVVVRLANAS